MTGAQVTGVKIAKSSMMYHDKALLRPKTNGQTYLPPDKLKSCGTMLLLINARALVNSIEMYY